MVHLRARFGGRDKHEECVFATLWHLVASTGKELKKSTQITKKIPPPTVASVHLTTCTIVTTVEEPQDGIFGCDQVISALNQN